MIRTDIIYIIAFSGGKDSIAMVLHLLEKGVPRENIHLHHHDVDGGGTNIWDWACTTSYCEAFAKAFGLKLFISYRVGGIDRETLRQNEGLQNVKYQIEPGGEFLTLESKPGSSTRLKFPAITTSLTTRWCSGCVKIDVMDRVIVAMYPTGDYIVCTGERREESGNRAKYNEREPHRKCTLTRRVETWRPVIDWTEEEVWGILERWKVQAHPCYMLGFPRCSCQICIFGGNDAWASNYQLSPAKVKHIADREKLFDHTLYNGIDIMSKVEKGTSFILQKDLDRWGYEALHEFVSPIIVENWVLPPGAYKEIMAGAA